MFKSRTSVMILCKDGILRPQQSMRTKEEVVDDFWKRVDIKSPTECWEWTAGKNGKTRITSYGVFWAGGKRHKAHRFAFEISVRPLNKGELACHKCDNPSCCNPSHIYAGNHLSNMRDCISRGRLDREKGEDRYCCKLTVDKVRNIKKRWQNGDRGFVVDLAAEYGVSKSAIYNIIYGLRWKHVT